MTELREAEGTLDEIATGGSRSLERITGAVNTARRAVWAGITARHGGLPGVRIAGLGAGGGDVHPAGRDARSRIRTRS